MKERGILFSLLWTAIWISNDKSFALVKANIAPSSAPWTFQGPTSSPTPESGKDQTKRQKKVRKVKKKRQTESGDYTDAIGDTSAAVETKEGDEDPVAETKEESTIVEEKPSTDNVPRKKRRKVKIKRRRRGSAQTETEQEDVEAAQEQTGPGVMEDAVTETDTSQVTPHVPKVDKEVQLLDNKSADEGQETLAEEPLAASNAEATVYDTTENVKESRVEETNEEDGEGVDEEMTASVEVIRAESEEPQLTAEESTESMHETFEREIARVDNDYVPNLAEFDTTASEDEGVDEMASVESTNSVEGGKLAEDANAVPEPKDQREDEQQEEEVDKVSSSDAFSDAEQPNAETASVTGNNASNVAAEDTALDEEDTEQIVDDAAAAADQADATADIAVQDDSAIDVCSSKGEESLVVDDTSAAEVDEKIKSGEQSGTTAEPEKEKPMTSPSLQTSSITSAREMVKLDDIDDDESDDSDLTVSIVTWNLAEESPSVEDALFIRKFRDTPTIGEKGSKSSRKGSDIVLVSGQECENTKPRRAEGHRSREFRRLMIKMLGRKYVPLAIHSLGGVQFGLFCKRSILGDVESVSVADVACGIGNVFHNKGAIAAFVQMKARERKAKAPDTGNADVTESPTRAKSLRMLFITAHMAAHVKNIEARNMDYWRIASELEDQAPTRFLPPRPTNSLFPEGEDPSEPGSGSHLMDSVDRVFFCGDLNYRVDLPRELAESTVKDMLDSQRQCESDADGSTEKEETLRETLLLHDQLLQTIAGGHAFPGFAEGKITFLPTFKFDKDTKDYDTSHNQRIPAWTDRILFKPFGVRVLKYTSVEDATHSDHRPVYGQFRVNMQGREVEKKEGRRRRSKRDRE